MPEFLLNEIILGVPQVILTAKIRQKLQRGGYEANEARAVLLSVEPGDRVLELGAGLGYIGALAAKIAGPENVISVEANPDMLEIIEANFLRNGCAAIDLRHGAVVGDSFAGETLSFRQARAFWASSVHKEGGPQATHIDVPVIRFNALMKEHLPHVVVMDIEGAEDDLFNAPWPDHVRALIMEIHPGIYDDAVIKKMFDCLSASGLVYAPDLSRGKLVGFLRLGSEMA